MMDKIRIPADLGQAIRRHRDANKLSAVHIAQRSGRSRDILPRLERGEDVTVASLFDILRAMGLTVRLETLGMPTLDEMRQRFSNEADDEGRES